MACRARTSAIWVADIAGIPIDFDMFAIMLGSMLANIADIELRCSSDMLAMASAAFRSWLGSILLGGMSPRPPRD